MVFSPFFAVVRKPMFFKKSGPVYLIAGLGNPGIQYENTRHNAGFMAIDALCSAHGVTLRRLKFHAYTEMAELGGQKCLLMKPQTYMNNSGEAVSEAADFYKIAPENILVFSDDISLDPGRLRIRRKGSAGGHNGLKSIIQLTGSENFVRVKIGVGKKPAYMDDLADWVLSRFTPDEKKLVESAAKHAAEAAELIVAGEIDRAMNLYNT